MFTPGSSQHLLLSCPMPFVIARSSSTGSTSLGPKSSTCLYPSVWSYLQFSLLGCWVCFEESSNETKWLWTSSFTIRSICLLSSIICSTCLVFPQKSLWWKMVEESLSHSLICERLCATLGSSNWSCSNAYCFLCGLLFDHPSQPNFLGVGTDHLRCFCPPKHLRQTIRHSLATFPRWSGFVNRNHSPTRHQSVFIEDDFGPHDRSCYRFVTCCSRSKSLYPQTSIRWKAF